MTKDLKYDLVEIKILVKEIKEKINSILYTQQLIKWAAGIT